MNCLEFLLCASVVSVIRNKVLIIIKQHKYDIDYRSIFHRTRDVFFIESLIYFLYIMLCIQDCMGILP